MTATADIVNFSDYRKARQKRETKASGEMAPMVVGWVPVWVMVPVPMMPMMPVATFA